MAVDGHQRSVPIPMGPWATRAATDRGREANRRTAWGRDGARCRSGPKSPGPTASGSWTRSRVRCSSRPTAPGPAYQPPAMDDFGYGDPGYSDPSYEGPKAPYGNPAFPAGHGTDHGPATPVRSGTSAAPATGRRAHPAACPDTRYRRSAIPPCRLIRGRLIRGRPIRGPPIRRLVTQVPAISRSRSRRRPAAARTSGRSPALRRRCPTPARSRYFPVAHPVALPRAAPRTRSSGTTVRAWTTGP